MKRGTIRVFSILAWALIVCTLASIQVEKAMTARVAAAERSSFGPAVLPMESLVWDGDYHLFMAEDGTGWESGTRARELDGAVYTVYDYEALEEGITPHVAAAFPWSGRLIQFWSRPLRDGEPVEVLEERETGEDTYLVIARSPLPQLETLPLGLTLADRTERVLLLSDAVAAAPFLEGEVRARLAGMEELSARIQPRLAEEVRVYSLGAAEEFWAALPRLAAALVLALLPAAFWAGALSRRRWDRRLILSGLSLTGADGVCLGRLLSGLTLPPSLMPGEMAFDFGHYRAELEQVLSGLAALEREPLAWAALRTARERSGEALAVLVVGGFLTCLAGLAAARVKRSCRQQ